LIAYFDGQFVDRHSVTVSPDDRGFLFADGVYEVIRAYGGRPFGVKAHTERLVHSLSEVRLDWPGAGDLGSLVTELLAQNGLDKADALIYLQVTRGVWPRSHEFPPPGTPPTVYATARPYEPPRDLAQGVAVVLEPDIRWGRCDIKSIGLLPNVLAYQRARETGAAEAVLVRDHIITEGTHTNVCAVVGGAVVTHAPDRHVLAGITLREVRAICGDLSVPWRETGVADWDLVVGTTMEVTAVVRVDGNPVAGGRPGPVGARLLAALRQRTAS
jgi:D-alanine transaminase